jgi:hypothetical protein
MVYANIPKPGAYLEGTVTIKYEDGSEVVIGSEDRSLFQLLNYWSKQQSVITYQDKKLWGISTDINLRFTIDPPDKSLNAQFWVLYWLELKGPFFQGTRGYSGLTGFVDIPLNQYEALRGFNKWNAKVSNPSMTWNYIGSFVAPFYQEATSSFLVDLSTYIANPKDVTDALNGIPLVGRLADVLSARISAATVKNGDRPLLVNWDMTGPDFYVRLKRSNFDGLSVHLGDFSVGAGEFCRMYEGDTYQVSFKVGCFFRSQDITGDWTAWKSGTVTIATFTMKIQAGSWYVLSADVSGGVSVS